MSRKMQSKWIADAAILAQHLAAEAKQSVLESRLEAYRRGVLTFNASAASSDTVTTEVETAAVNDSPVADLTSKGIFTGSVSGANDVKKVLIREAGTDNGISDGLDDEIYGVLSEADEVFTLSYKKSDGTAYAFSSATDIDFYFVEVLDTYQLPADANLYQSVSGVIDAGSSTTLSGHLDGGSSKHDASEIDVEGATYNYVTQDTDLESAIGELDTQMKTNADAISALESGDKYEKLTLDATDISNKYKDLTSIPKTANQVSVFVAGGLKQVYGTDFAIITDGSDNKRLIWDSTDENVSAGMEADLESGDILEVYYKV